MPGMWSPSTGISTPESMKGLASIPRFVSRYPEPWTISAVPQSWQLVCVCVGVGGGGGVMGGGHQNDIIHMTYYDTYDSNILFVFNWPVHAS